MCQINTDPMTYQSAWLSVMIPPDIDMSRTSGDISTREHEDTARLTCHANGVPRPKIVWRREGGGKIRVKTSHHQHRLKTNIYRNFLSFFHKLFDQNC